MSKRLPLITAIILGLLAVFLSNRYFQKKEKELFQGTKPKPVLVAARDIPADTIIKKSDIKIAQIPAKFIQPSAVNSIKAVVDKMTTAFIFKGEQIVSTKLVSPENSALRKIAFAENLVLLKSAFPRNFTHQKKCPLKIWRS